MQWKVFPALALDVFRKNVTPLVGYRPLHVHALALSPKTQSGLLGTSFLVQDLASSVVGSGGPDAQ